MQDAILAITLAFFLVRQRLCVRFLRFCCWRNIAVELVKGVLSVTACLHHLPPRALHRSLSVPLAAESDLLECATYWGKFIRRTRA